MGVLHTKVVTFKKREIEINIRRYFCSEGALVFNSSVIVSNIATGSSTKFFHSSVPSASHSSLCPVTRNLSLKWNNDEEEKIIRERTRLRKRLLFNRSTRYASTKEN